METTGHDDAAPRRTRVYSSLRLDLGGGLVVRTLAPDDGGMLVEATRGEVAPALWGPRPAGPYTMGDATAALRAWDPCAGGQVSFGVLADDRLLAALGLMPDDPGSAELAYWTSPEARGRGIAASALGALTGWAHRHAGLRRLWLEIDPGNAASLAVARRAGYRFDRSLPRHCRAWADEDPARDRRHDCLIWADDAEPSTPGHD